MMTRTRRGCCRPRRSADDDLDHGPHDVVTAALDRPAVVNRRSPMYMVPDLVRKSESRWHPPLARVVKLVQKVTKPP